MEQVPTEAPVWFGKVCWDATTWPLVVVSHPNGQAPFEDQMAYLEHQRQLLLLGQRFAIITDATSASKMPPAHERAAFGEWMKQNAFPIRQCTVASAIVLDSALARGAITAMYWIKKPDIPTRFFKDYASSIPWILQRLEQEGVEVTPALSRFADTHLRKAQ